MEKIEIRRLSFYYPEQSEPALSDIDFELRGGEFVLLCGPSGSGKSTLLRQLKPTLTPHGSREGELLFDGRPLDELSPSEQASRIGFVLQSPDEQSATDKVWHELAFGLESLGLDTPSIRRRVAEMAAFFGIQDWYYKNVSELSGGQKQLLNLASVMVMQPELLILDEPTSQLDPIAASDFIAALGKINRELGTTVLLSEHRLEEAFAYASRAAVMDGGKIICSGTPTEVGEALRSRDHSMFRAMPTAMRVWASVGEGDCPITVREGRDWLREYAGEHTLKALPAEAVHTHGEVMLEAHELFYRYERELPDTVRGLSLSLRRGELLALLGGNGAGKTTALRLLSGALKPSRGEIIRRGRIAMLPQDPQALFTRKTVREELFEMTGDESEVGRIVKLCRLEGLLGRHPYDLSGGERQRAALAKLLLTGPDILLLDEPTKGLDAGYKRIFAHILDELTKRGAAVLMVSHDVEFCAEHAHRCGLFFGGGIVAEGTPREFFSGNSFYTTSADRMSRGICEAVTTDELIAVCGGTPDQPEDMTESNAPAADESKSAAPEKSDSAEAPLPLWRRIAALIAAIAAAVIFVRAIKITDFAAGGSNESLILCAAFIGALTLLALAVGRRSEFRLALPGNTGRLSKRTKAASALILLLVPLTLLAGQFLTGGRKYYLISMLVLLECMLPFFLIFEGRKPEARELSLIAVLCAIGVAGRAAFFMLPQFKPVTALTIIAGAALGGEVGFLVGAMTMLASNVMFSQGPWTPWQMFAMGLIGFLAGILYRRGFLGRGRISLCVFGALSALIIYGGIMNTSTALMWNGELSPGIILTYIAAGFPMDCVHAAATALFLWFAARPMLELLDRIKIKYGMLEGRK